MNYRVFTLLITALLLLTLGARQSRKLQSNLCRSCFLSHYAQTQECVSEPIVNRSKVLRCSSLCYIFRQPFQPETVTVSATSLLSQVPGNVKYFEADTGPAPLLDGSAPDYVTIWSNGEVSYTVTLAPVLYKVEVRAYNDMPGPVRLQFYINHLKSKMLLLDADDASWETKCFFITPLHWFDARSNEATLRIRFVNDGGPGGTRDASIAWVKLTPLRNDG